MNRRHLTLASSIAILFLILAYAIGRVDLGHPQTGDSSKPPEDAALGETILDNSETGKAISDPIGKPALVEHSESENVPIDADLRQLMASGSGASLATVCGYDRFLISDHIESVLGIRKATDRFNLTDSQLQALSEFEDRCKQFLNVLDDDPSLVPTIKQQEESYERYVNASAKTVGTTGWNETFRSESLNALSSGFPALAAFAAMDLLLYDRATQEIVAEYLGTKDIGYVSSLGPAVALLVECRMQGNCGRNSFSALRYCLLDDEILCGGIQQGLSNSRSYGQYEDILTVANALMDLLKH